ncbi:MAG: hypothetical protein E6K32_03975 [Gammaproteobacteria bacterium]|nr:MAG: hypothetical protein E6K32_03975 [Gammaproteobacteria bacterium]
MSAKVVDICSAWQQAADASDWVALLMDEIPAGGDGFTLTTETEQELREAASLLQRANELLRRAAAREVPRYNAWTVDRPEWNTP